MKVRNIESTLKISVSSDVLHVSCTTLYGAIMKHSNLTSEMMSEAYFTADSSEGSGDSVCALRGVQTRSGKTQFSDSFAESFSHSAQGGTTDHQAQCSSDCS